jgi:hypothetical protein
VSPSSGRWAHLPETLFLSVVLLVLFYLLDSFWYRNEGAARPDPTPDTERFGFDGAVNFAAAGRGGRPGADERRLAARRGVRHQGTEVGLLAVWCATWG